MAKKRRKPNNRPRQPQVRAAVRTEERPEAREERQAQASSRPRTRTEPAAASKARAEKKELARRQRDEMRRRIQRQQRMRRVVWVVAGAAVVALAVFWFTRPEPPPTPTDQLPGLLTSEAPWPANGDQAPERADAINLPPEGTTMHEHANVQIFVNGAQQPIPVDVGIDTGAGEVTSLHTHEDSGTVHMESSQQRDFTLGEFFDIWGVRLTPTCLGGYCESGDETLRVFRAGEEVTTPIRDIVLDDQTVFVVTFGTEDELPDPIPSAFDFASVPQ